jgi:hypothetical protein
MFWLLVVLALALPLALKIARNAREARRAMRQLEEETRDRHARDGVDGVADVDPEDVLHALIALVDIHGVAAVYQEKDSNVVYILAAAWMSEALLRLLRDSIRFSVPIGLSARVVRSPEDIPKNCVVCAKGWAA